jgi:adenosylmethionine-8-amino-7-oxononanoate aminotransferase
MDHPTTQKPGPSLAQLDHAHLWHPFTAMKQWNETDPLIIERAQGFELIDTQGKRYIDGVSSLWCNVHGHRVPEIDQAIREQLDKVAHSTLLGLSNEPAILLAAELVRRASVLSSGGATNLSSQPLSKVFYSDSGATAVEIAIKMAVGYWHHTGRPGKRSIVALGGAYHGDTVGAMSVGFSDLFHTPFRSMVFPVRWLPVLDAVRPGDEVRARVERANAASNAEQRDGQTLCRSCQPRGKCESLVWPSECPALAMALLMHGLTELENLLQQHAHEIAALVIEPVVQGAAGMICQPGGYLFGVSNLCKKYEVLLIADEVATGFCRTGTELACESQAVTPDLLCLAKGLTGGYLPLAATLSTQSIYDAYCGDLSERKTFYHGHTFTGNPLGCAAALACLKLIDDNRTLDNARTSAAAISHRLGELRDPVRFPHVIDVRQRGLMVGIELARDRHSRTPLDFSRTIGSRVCLAMREHSVIVRPLGSVIVLMPAPAMDQATLQRLLSVVIQTIESFRDECTSTA